MVIVHYRVKAIMVELSVLYEDAISLGASPKRLEEWMVNMMDRVRPTYTQMDQFRVAREKGGKNR